MANFPDEYELPGPRRRDAVARADFFDSRISLLAFLKANPDLPGVPSMSDQYLIPEGSPAERKAKADEIAARLHGTAEWRNGYYMAMVRGVEIHFVPPIFLADADGDGGDSDA